MAILFADGFDHYAGNVLAGGWDELPAGGGSTGVADSRFGVGQGYHISNQDQACIKWVGPAGPTVGMSMAVKLAAVTDGVAIFAFFDGTTRQVDVRIGNARQLYFTRNGTTIVSPAGPVLTLGVWYHLEVKVFFHGSAGTAEARINEVTAVSGSGLNTMATGNNTYNRARWWSFANGGQASMDDVVLWDDTGTKNTDWLGDCKIETLYPGGAGNSTQMTPSAGSNWQCVDEAQANDDTDYVSSATPGQVDTYALGNLAISGGSVKAVIPVLRHRKDDAGARTLRRVLRSGGADYEGPDVAVLDSYSWASDIVQTDPAGGDWDITKVNALQAGVKLQA